MGTCGVTMGSLALDQRCDASVESSGKVWGWAGGVDIVGASSSWVENRSSGRVPVRVSSDHLQQVDQWSSLSDPHCSPQCAL